MTFGLVDVGYSLSKEQAVKLIFFAPCVDIASSYSAQPLWQSPVDAAGSVSKLELWGKSAVIIANQKINKFT